MEAEFKQLEERIRRLIQRVRELEAECEQVQARFSELEALRQAAAARISGILDRLEEPE